jgi:Zn-dependent protease
VDLSAPFILILVFFSVVCHELAHGMVAWKLGDPTAWRAGRLTFNPLPHIDLFGTIILPVMLRLMGSQILFAWAKPVPVDPRYFRNPRKGMMYVAASGPGTNLAIALLFAGLAHAGAAFLPFWALKALAWSSLINIILMVFNLVPIPPLDGSRIVAGFLRGRLLWNYMRIEPFGLFITFGLLYLGFFSGLFGSAQDVAIRTLGLLRFLLASG